jgi:hypothetical protein
MNYIKNIDDFNKDEKKIIPVPISKIDEELNNKDIQKIITNKNINIEDLVIVKTKNDNL